jgi:integrase/recombinase XerD
MRLDYALEGFWLSKRQHFSPNTIADYELTFRRVREFVGDKEVEAITSADLNRFLDHLANKLNLGPKTILNHWIALSSFWSWASGELSIPHIVRDHVARPKVTRRQSQPYERHDVEAMIDACEKAEAWDSKRGRHVMAKRPTGLRDKAMLLMMLDCGIRVSELVALRMRDYDRRRGQVTIHHGKGDKKRIIYLGESARAAVWKYLGSRNKVSPDDALFVTRSGQPMNRVNVLHMVERLGERAGVANAGPHRFRHTFAINYLRNGGNLLSLQEMLGHEKLETVRIYAKLAEVDLEKTQRAASPADNWRL